MNKLLTVLGAIGFTTLIVPFFIWAGVWALHIFMTFLFKLYGALPWPM